jgi:hypothetical protein
MVGMAVRRDDAADRMRVECRRKMPIPQRARRRITVPAIDERHAVIVREQPQIDVIEREWQRHPQPAEARHDLDRIARGGRRGDRVLERCGESRVHRSYVGMAVARRKLTLRRAMSAVGRDFVQRSIVFEATE